MNWIVKSIVLLVILGSLQGLLLAFILGRNRMFNKTSNWYLSVFILAFSLSNLHYVAHVFGLMEAYNWLNYLTFPWTFLIPIVFYLFIKFLLNPDYTLKGSLRFLFFPFVIQVVFHFSLFALAIFDVKLSPLLEKVIIID